MFFYDLMTTLASVGIDIRYLHHEVGPGQFEMPCEHGKASEVAYKTSLFKYLVKQVARRHRFAACFMPKPITGSAGSGSHVHMSLVAATDGVEINGRTYKKGENVFANDQDSFQDGSKTYHLSEAAHRCCAALLKYAAVIMRLTNPSYNSFKRLGEREAPGNLVVTPLNRSGCIRLVYYEKNNPRKARIEFRPPDACGNIYAKLYAIAVALRVGMKEEDLPRPNVIENLNLFLMPAEDKAALGIEELPKSMEEIIENMDNPQYSAFTDILLGPKGTPLRDYLSQPVDILPGDLSIPEAEAAATGAIRGNMLIVENDATLRGLLRMHFERGGWTVEQTVDSTSVDVGKYDLILTDWRTVEGSNITSAVEALEQDKRPIVIVHTGAPGDVTVEPDGQTLVVLEKTKVSPKYIVEQASQLMHKRHGAAWDDIRYKHAKERLDLAVQMTAQPQQPAQAAKYVIFAPSVSEHLSVLARLDGYAGRIVPIVSRPQQKAFLESRGIRAVLCEEDTQEAMQAALQDAVQLIRDSLPTPDAEIQIDYRYTAESQAEAVEADGVTSQAVVLSALNDIMVVVETMGITIVDKNGFGQVIEIQRQVWEDV
jgi:hypothetical protein